MAGLKKWVPSTDAGPSGHCPNGVDVEIGRIGCENCTLCGEAIEIAEYLFLDIHFLEHSFDNDVSIRHRCKIGAAFHQLVAALHLGIAQAPALERGAVVLSDHVEPAGQCFFRGFDDGHRNAGIGEAHGDAAAHGAGADDGGTLDIVGLCIFRQVGDLGRRALGEEYMALGFRLIAILQLNELVVFEFQSLVDRQVDSRAQDFDRRSRRVQAARPFSVWGNQFVEFGTVAFHASEFALEISGPTQRRLIGNKFAGKCDCCGGHVAIDNGIDQAGLQRRIGADRFAGQDHRQRLFHSDQAWQPLRAAGAGNEPELDFRKAQS